MLLGVPEPFHRLESRLQVAFEVKSIMMITGDDASRSDDIALSVSNRQDVRCFRSFTRLVGHTLTTFLGNGVAAIQIEFRKIQLVLNGHNTGLPHLFQAAIPAPLAKMIVNGIMVDFFFSGLFGSGSIGS